MSGSSSLVCKRTFRVMTCVTISFSTLKMLSEGLLPVFRSMYIYRGVPQQNATTDKIMTPQGIANPSPQPNVSWMYDMMEFPKRLPLHIPKYHHWKNRLFIWFFCSAGRDSMSSSISNWSAPNACNEGLYPPCPTEIKYSGKNNKEDGIHECSTAHEVKPTRPWLRIKKNDRKRLLGQLQFLTKKQ